MLASVLTALFFALSITFAARSSRYLGGMRANLARMAISLLFLGVWAHTLGSGSGSPAFPLFFLSGIIGFGFGDVGLYMALPRLGPRLAILLCQCLAAPAGALIEWVWMDTRPSANQMLCGLLILAGVGIALAPERSGKPHTTGSFSAGVLLGICAAIGQACGAVISRKAYALASSMNFIVDGGTAAYERMLGGILFAGLVYLFSRKKGDHLANAPWAPASKWVVLNALAGPTIGVACYQWALSQAPTAIVLPVVAMTPILTIPFAYWLTGERPLPLSLVGGCVAVAGAIGLYLL